MLSLFLIYFVGKAFYTLAFDHRKSGWLFAILGVASYYVGSFIGGVFLGLFIELGLSRSVNEFSNIELSLMSLPMGVLVCWGFYMILKKAWQKPSALMDEEVLDGDLSK